MHLKNATQHDCTLISFGVVVSGKSFPGAAVVLSFSENYSTMVVTSLEGVVSKKNISFYEIKMVNFTTKLTDRNI